MGRKKLTRRRESLLQPLSLRQTSIHDKFWYNEERGELKLIPGRLDFWDSTNRALRVASNQARCHSFSQDFIAATLHNIISLAIEYPSEKMPVQMLLSRLGMMVYGNNLTEELLNYDSKIVELYRLDIPNHIGETVDLANDLMRKLNNSLYNLRKGNRNWNSSISNDFDPAAWAYVADVGGSRQFVSQDALEWQPDTLGRPAGIHLTDTEDVKRLVNYRELRSMLPNDYAFGIDVYEGQLDGTPCYVAGSSSNQFPKPAGCRPQNCQAIYIYNNGKWESVL